MKEIVRLMSVQAEIRDMGWLKESLRAAIRLELSTIPPYLYAAWSIDPTSNSPCIETIKGIAREEMLHLGIAANMLAAVGGKPDFLRSAQPYPTVLPHVHEGLAVGLAPLSETVLVKVFMAIEEPVTHLFDDDKFTPSGSRLIGDFYAAVLDTTVALSPTFSTGKQVDLDIGLPGGGSFVIADLDDVRAAVDLITRQGEGTAATPFENQGNPDELAHFYQFGEIAHGAKLTRTPPFSYTGDPVPMPPVRDHAPAPAALPAGRAFDQAYSDMLRLLDKAWKGEITLAEATFAPMFDLTEKAQELFAAGHGPAFRVVDENGNPIGPQPGQNRLARVKEILDAALGSASAHAHGAFWRPLTRDQFVAKKVLGKQLVVPGDGASSNLVKALRGQKPFGKDQGVPGATTARMPQGLEPAPDVDIDFIADWIDDGCPDAPAVAHTPEVSRTTGAVRLDPTLHNTYFRQLDDWAMWKVTDDVRQMIEDVQTVNFTLWPGYALDASGEQAWLDGISDKALQPAFELLAQRQQDIVVANYGTPVPLLTLLDAYERFGNDGLPDDPLRPQAPRHNMDSPVMWFMLAAFADACTRLGIAAEFWTFFQRPILCGLLNDGLFRPDRFTVTGFPATPDGRDAVFTFVQQVADTDLAAEIRTRYAESGLDAG